MSSELVRALYQHADTRPEQLALAGCRRDYTWFELEHVVMAAATALRERGVTSCVGFCGWNDELYLILLLASQVLGISLVLFHPRWSTPEYARAMEMVPPQLLITDLHVPDVVGCAVMGLTDFESLCCHVPVEPVCVGGGASLVMFTSGTTGNLKAVVLNTSQLVSSAMQFVSMLGLSADDRQYLAAPLFHIAGMGCLTLPLVLTGGSTILTAEFDAQDVVARGIVQIESTCMFMLPQMWSEVLALMHQREVCWPSARVALVGGAPSPRSLLERGWAQRIPWFIGYGMTELAPMCTIAPPTLARQKPGCVGKTHALMSVCIRDGAHMLKPGHVGQVFVRGPNVFAGYWDATAGVVSATDAQGWFGTRDMGYLDEGGDLWLCGRQGDMIITGGENVYPEEVERALSAVSGIEQAVVFGTPHPKWGEAVTAAIVGDRYWDVDSLREHLSSLSRYKCPRRILNVTHFELTPGRKISRQALVHQWKIHHDPP